MEEFAQIVLWRVRGVAPIYFRAGSGFAGSRVRVGTGSHSAGKNSCRLEQNCTGVTIDAYITGGCESNAEAWISDS